MKYIIISIISFFVFLSGAFAQPSAASLNLKKPKKYEDKLLTAEKSDDKKFGVKRRFIQNAVTHYNYYYNANARLDEIVARAKASFKDDYTQLLPFYNYNTESALAFKQDIDSVIYKATAGILLHDLRNSWVDNLYLILGKAYYLRNDLDSAYLTFQYVNYAFSPKEKDGWDKIIGSNQNEGGNIFSISTKENNNIVHRALTRPPSRNESFIWQIRTYLAKNELADAAGLIETLKNDPLFPKRLHTDLQEMQALLFYKQKMYDSAAFHLENALGNADGKQEQARWEYLIAQLYERAGNREQAKVFYNRATKHTIDPLLEVHSILNALRQDGKEKGNEQGAQRAIDELQKMARRDKYFQYRDIVYYTAANIEEERNNPEAAKILLLKSVKYSMNPDQKSKSFLALGDISFEQHQYVAAKAYYDSVNTNSVDPSALVSFNALKSTLDKITVQSTIVTRQDSLQRIASMPLRERDAFIKKIVKQLRRGKGLKEESVTTGSDIYAVSNNKGPVDLFGNTTKAEWYFYNANLKTKGHAEFLSKWGNRPNSDNWRRSSIIVQQFDNNNIVGLDVSSRAAAKLESPEISYNALLANLPLTPAQQKVSLDSIEHALFALGKIYQDGLEDYTSAITAYERLLNTFPNSGHKEETLFNLYYCYGKVGRPSNQQEVKQLLTSSFPSGNFNFKLNNPTAASPDSIKKKEATLAYDEIYNLFIEGKFAEALAKKAITDSKFGKKYWTPQLLYIEAVYDIKQRNDSSAKSVLNNIINLFPNSPLKIKSSNLLDVLNRRKEIEDYLTNLKIEHHDDEIVITNNEPIITPIAKDTVTKKEIVTVPAVKDTSMNAKEAKAITKVPAEEPKKPITAIVNVDKQAVNPQKNAVTLPKSTGIDTAQLKKPEVIASTYGNRPEQPHYVVFVMNKVDPVYVSEAKNAFNRYNRENYSGKTIELNNIALTDDIKMLLFNKFENAGTAIDYIEKAKKLAATEIIPWLTAQKYTFIMITEDNLQILKNTKDVDAYRKFLTTAYPGRGF